MTAEVGSVGTSVAAEIGAPAGVQTATLSSMVGEVAPQITDFNMSVSGNPFAGLETYSPSADMADVGGLATPLDSPQEVPEATSLIAEAEAIAESAWNNSEPTSPTVSSVSGVEARAQAMAVYAGLFGVPVGSPETRVEADQAHQEAGLATNEALVEAIEVPVDIVEEAVQSVATHNIPEALLEVAQPEKEVLVGNLEEAVIDEITEPERLEEMVSESSDEAVADRVATLAEEIGRHDIAEDVRGMDESQAEKMFEEVEKSEIVTDEEGVNVQASYDQLEDEKTEKKRPEEPSPDNKDDPKKIRVDEGANSRRKELIYEAEKEEAAEAENERRTVSAERVAYGFEKKAQEDDRARSGLLKQIGFEDFDGGITEIAHDLQNVGTNNLPAVSEKVVSSHTAVVLANSGSLAPEKAVQEALRGGRSRRYASVAA